MTKELAVTVTLTGAVCVPSVNVIVHEPTATGVTTAVYGDVDDGGAIVTMPLHVFVSLKVPPKFVSCTSTDCVAAA
jgi:hypothetical protein